jgi:glycerol-3-phosphate dehydrogenase
MGKGILVSPTVDNNLILGPTSVNIEEKDNKSTTSDGLLSVIEKAKENLNAVPLQKTIRSFCGLRAVGSTGDFIINSPCDNFINVAGIESPGLSASPAIAEYVVNLLKELCLELKENKNFCPYRRSFHAFFDASTEEKNKIIKENAAFGKIVCRCEGITEGEIIDAIKRNPRATDLDGVKRRTRAQMGRCQGGFCGPQIIEIIARETCVPFESVTKFGKGSLITFERTKGGNL